MIGIGRVLLVVLGFFAVVAFAISMWQFIFGDMFSTVLTAIYGATFVMFALNVDQQLKRLAKLKEMS